MGGFGFTMRLRIGAGQVFNSDCMRRIMSDWLCCLIEDLMTVVDGYNACRLLCFGLRLHITLGSFVR